MENSYTKKINFLITEGFVLNEQSTFMTQFMKENSIKNVMEIGFNGGVSSSVFLSSGDDVSVTSFDIGEHEYVHSAKKLIDEVFSPDRHVLILGDSTETVPKFKPDDTELFDLVFVDGGHAGDIPELDIKNSHRLLKKGGFFIIDDFCYAYGLDVMKGVKRCIDQGLVTVHSGPFFGDGDRGWIVLSKV